MNNNNRTLEFNDIEIINTYVDGQYWIAIKPICEALNVNYKHQANQIKNDEILGQLSRQYKTVAQDGRKREMTCLPEKFIYGWLFSVRSDSPALLQYKRDCYEVLFNHFNGTLAKRLQVLGERSQLDKEISQKKAELAKSSISKELQQLTLRKKNCSAMLTKLDKDMSDQQKSLFG